MAFGIYIHIPYCLQRCSYCDFATVGFKQSIPPQDYYQLLCHELQLRRPLAPADEVSSLYFGGGTPSLVGPDFILGFMREIQNQGFSLKADIEVTMEINPATMDLEQLRRYMRGGVNRFSVGAQTFNEIHLKKTLRLHSAQDTRETLRLLASEKANYTFDLLFALPHQTLGQLEMDVEEALLYNPPHLSAYCLTVPDQHPMALGRAEDDEQVEMFHLIQENLKQAGLERYEISNFAKPGRESRHNLIYWTDQPYLGLGMSAHSYLPEGEWGTRFWNARSVGAYQRQIQEARERGSWPLSRLDEDQKEPLRLHQALTDFAHTSLRRLEGLDLERVQKKFPLTAAESLQQRLQALLQEELLERTSRGYALSQKGLLLSNLVFEKLTFLESELESVDKSSSKLIFKDVTW